LDILIQNEHLSDKESETAKTVYGAIDKLSRLSQSLLLITKIGNSQFENKIPVPLTFRIQEKLSQFSELWETNNIQVTSQLAEADIIANEELIDILLNNLLSNATKHNIINGKIFVALKQGSLLIVNTGRINPLDPNKLFKRFYKDAQYSANNGLGLSIIKQICDESGIDPSYEFKDDQHGFLLLW
jgi:signal transduction histidine kinase